MKKVTINYRNASGDFTANGKTNDLAIRKILDKFNNPIHTAKGRLSLDALLKRAAKTNVTILDVNVNGSFTYQRDVPNDVPKDIPKDVPKNEDKSFKFQVSRFDNQCAETGKAISKGDIVLYERTEKVTYCSDASLWVSLSKDDSIYGVHLTKSESAKPVDEPKERSQSSDVATPPVDAANPFGMFAEMMKPYLKQSEINQEQIDEMIRKALSGHSKQITVKREELPPIDIGAQHHMFEELCLFAANRINVQLTGAAGSGKTHAAGEVAKALDLPFYAISVGAMTTKTDFQGYMDARGDYVITLFRQAFEHGGVFLLDEMDAGNANVITTINMALSNGHAAFPDGMIEKHDDFVLIAGANTYGNGADRMYVGRNQLDAASIDRFAVMDWDYDESIEIKIACNDRWTRYVQKCRANMNRLKMRYVISPRASINGGIMLKAGMTVDRVKQTILFKSMKAEDIKKVTEGVTY